jgi:hypothetical protein
VSLGQWVLHTNPALADMTRQAKTRVKVIHHGGRPCARADGMKMDRCEGVDPLKFK